MIFDILIVNLEIVSLIAKNGLTDLLIVFSNGSVKQGSESDLSGATQ